jgi:hypothetical protein
MLTRESHNFLVEYLTYYYHVCNEHSNNIDRILRIFTRYHFSDPIIVLSDQAAMQCNSGNRHAGGGRVRVRAAPVLARG